YYATEERSEVDTCPNCGESVRTGARFCARCGTPIQSRNPRPMGAAQTDATDATTTEGTRVTDDQRRRRTTWMIIFGIAVIGLSVLSKSDGSATALDAPNYRRERAAFLNALIVWYGVESGIGNSQEALMDLIQRSAPDSSHRPFCHPRAARLRRQKLCTAKTAGGSSAQGVERRHAHPSARIE
ncbi:MAG: zinc-ribbon domain-containing protein, partial [Dehalococcoidia bacterium]